jgi:hypothetical protein
LKEESQKIAVTPAQNITPHYSLPWIFQHQELLTSTTTERPWDQKKLVNKINHLNFIDGYVSLLLDHKSTSEYILLKAYPQPCIKDELVCRLDLQDDIIDLTEYSFNYLMIDDGLTAILAPIQLLNMENNTLKLNLPDESRVIRTRKTRRHYCQDIACEVIQDAFNAQGTLIDFTPSALGIKLSVNENINKFDENNSFEINLTQNGVKLYSGPCCLMRNRINSPDDKIVFTPLNTHMERFPKRKMRNPRQHITPSFAIRFKHPFFQKNTERDILEISTAGFSIIDNIEEEALLPGMIIPNISIIYTGIIKMDCSAQVLYRREDQENKSVQCGVAILDMDVKAYSYLNHILGAHLDSNARVSTNVDMEALWEFFFDTGFIYGEKYEHLHSYRQNFKETYQKLYQDNPDIARHFVYEKNGNIYGHIAMVHAYNPSWLIHHFSARPLESRIPGIIILRQITNYINGFYRFSSGNMNFVMTYYRPENRVVDKIFGGFARHLNNPKGSSLDLFSYMLFQKTSPNKNLPSGCILHECTSEDFKILKDFYDTYSGGLMLDAFGLDSQMQPLIKAFTNAGFKRNCKTFCLCINGKHVAFFIVNQSNLGLNLSDLINGIKIIIIRDEGLKADILLSAVNKLSILYQENHIPLLVYPANYLSGQEIRTEKNYQLWILNNNPYSDQYTEYMDNNFRMKYKRN